MKQTGNRKRCRLRALLTATVLLLPLVAAGNSIVDITDWKPLDFEGAAARYDNAPGTGNWHPTVFPDTAIRGGSEPRWYARYAGGKAAVFAGAWDASRWTETDVWASSTPVTRFGEDAFLAELAGTDWIGISRYGDVRDKELYGLDELKLMVPEPATILLLAAAFGVAALAWHRRGPGTATVSSSPAQTRNSEVDLE